MDIFLIELLFLIGVFLGLEYMGFCWGLVVWGMIIGGLIVLDIVFGI